MGTKGEAILGRIGEIETTNLLKLFVGRGEGARFEHPCPKKEPDAWVVK
jgi:hypothetical protein